MKVFELLAFLEHMDDNQEVVIEFPQTHTSYFGKLESSEEYNLIHTNTDVIILKTGLLANSPEQLMNREKEK